MSEERPNLLRDERGQLVPMFAVGMFTLMLFTALVTNVGQAVVRKHQLQLVADMGAMAGAAEQAHGLNTMTRLNALNLRLFNTFQMRSRIGGYETYRVPFITTLNQLLSGVPKCIGVRWWEPFFGWHCAGFPLRSIISSALGAGMNAFRLPAGVSLLPWDPWLSPKGSGEEPAAFKAMDKTHGAIRDMIQAANYYYAYNATKVARSVTSTNLGTVFGKYAPPGRATTYERLVEEYDSDQFSFVSDPYDISASVSNTLNGIEGMLDSFTDPETIVTFFTSVSSLSDLSSSMTGIRPLIPNFENPDGDTLAVRFWSKMPSLNRNLIALEAGVIAGVACLELCLPWLYEYIKKMIIAEEVARFASAPSYSTLDVTLHRAEVENNDTYFVHWVRTPTTESSVGRMLFVDLPVMVAVAAAKPVNGNFGNYPTPEGVGEALLEDSFPGLGSLLDKGAEVLNSLLPADEYLDPEDDWESYKSSGLSFPDLLGDMGVRPMDEELEGDWVPDSSFFWYHGQNFPTYRARLVPIKSNWLPGMGLWEVFIWDRDVMENEDMQRLISMNQHWLSDQS